MNTRYLAHHGIKGQRWGVRRYENPDGSLTEAGKERYNKQAKQERNNKWDKERSQMSDKDLDEAISRIKKENELHKLTRPGITFVNAIMSDTGKKVLTTIGAGTLLYAGKAFISGQFNKLEFANAIFNGGAKKK